MQSENGGYKMLSELLKKYIDENVKEGDPHFATLYQCLGGIKSLEDRESEKKESEDDGEAPSIVNTDEKQSPSEIEEAMRITKEIFDSAIKIRTYGVFPSSDYMSDCVKLTEIMMDYIKSKQRVTATKPVLEILDIISEYFKPKVRMDPDTLEMSELLHNGDFIKAVTEKVLDTPFDDCRIDQKMEYQEPSL